MNLFARPELLWLLLIVPGLALWVARGRRRRDSAWRALGQSNPLRRDGALGWLGAVVCLCLALAQPRWGRRADAPLPPGHDVVLLVDASRSMGAKDAVPDRMGVAVESAGSLVKALGREPGNRAAVVAFAGRGRLLCPLTENLDAVADALRALRPGEVRPGGTDLAAGLESALDAFDAEDHSEGRTIVVFSDGEDLAGRWPAEVERLRAAGVLVHSVAIGDAARGHSVPSGKGSGVLVYDGSPVVSRRDDRAFEALARATGGAVIRLGLAATDLGRLYTTRIEPIARSRREAIRPSERVERFPPLLVAALVLGLAGSWPRRSRWIRPRRWVVLAFLSLAALGAGRSDDSAARLVERGRSAYSQGRFAEALAAFDRAIALNPRAAVPRYDAGAALFQLQRFPEALTRYQEARERAGAALRTKIDFALGNTALTLGDVAAALGHYDDCLGSTARGVALDAVRRDAAINRRFAEQQARQPSAPPESEQNPSDQNPRDRRPKGQQGEGSGSQSHSQSPGQGGSQGESAQDSTGAGRRGPGGAGGAGAAPPGPGSPEERLASALKNLREARDHRRIDDELPAADEHRRDW